MFAKLFISSLVCTSYVAAMAITQRSEISVALLPRDYPYTGTLTGDATWYRTGLGACGWQNNDRDLIVALSSTIYDNYPGYNPNSNNINPVCGKQASVSYQGKDVTVTIVDRCAGCAEGDLDMSPAAFSDISPDGTTNPGRLHGMHWTWL